MKKKEPQDIKNLPEYQILAVKERLIYCQGLEG
jgi:hypothetical protein